MFLYEQHENGTNAQACWNVSLASTENDLFPGFQVSTYRQVLSVTSGIAALLNLFLFISLIKFRLKKKIHSYFKIKTFVILVNSLIFCFCSQYFHLCEKEIKLLATQSEQIYGLVFTKTSSMTLVFINTLIEITMVCDRLNILSNKKCFFTQMKLRYNLIIKVLFTCTYVIPKTLGYQIEHICNDLFVRSVSKFGESDFFYYYFFCYIWIIFFNFILYFGLTIKLVIEYNKFIELKKRRNQNLRSSNNKNCMTRIVITNSFLFFFSLMLFVVKFFFELFISAKNEIFTCYLVNCLFFLLVQIAHIIYFFMIAFYETQIRKCYSDSLVHLYQRFKNIFCRTQIRSP